MIIIQTTDSVSYQLNNGSFQLDPTFFDVIGGNHELTLLDEYGCSYNYQTTISSPPPLVIENLDNFEINNGTIITIDPQISGGTAPYSYQWTGNQELECDFCETIDVAPIANSTYHLMVTDFNGCQVSTTFEVIVSNPQNLFIPNIFSPNNDGINDIHTVYASSDVEKVLSYQIFNKDGDLYFELKDFYPNSTIEGWDGKFDGIQLNPAVFICVVEVLFRNGERKQIIESVAIVN